MLRLVDRDAQLAALGVRWSRARSGSGHVTLVEGAVATGKTELLHTFADLVDDAPLRLRATCSPAERSLSLGVVAQLFLGVGLPSEFRRRTESLIERGTFGADTTQTLHGLCRELFELAARTPVLITVDDAQYADELSMRWLLCLARRVAAAPVLLILAAGADVAARAELTRLPHCATAHVGPLAEHGVHELLRARCGPPTANRLTATFLNASGGNPLLLNALLDDWRGGQGIAGSGYRRALLDCVRRCGPRALRVAQGLALLGEQASLRLVSALLELDPDVVAEAVTRLDSAGLLVEGGVAHANGRAELLAELPPHERARLHGRAARLCHEFGAAATTVARHIVHGGSEQDVPCADILLDAADTHLLDNELPAALQCLEHAVRHSADDRAAAAARVRLAQTAWYLDPIAAARQLNPLLDAPTDLLTTSQRIEICRQLLWQGHADQAASIFAQLTDDTDEEQEAFRLLVACTHPGVARAPRRAQPSRPPRPGPGSAWQRFSPVMADVLIHGCYDQVVPRCQQLFKESQVSRDFQWSADSPLLSLLPGVYAGALTDVAAWCERWHAAVPSREPMQRAQLAAVAAEIAARRGAFPVALDQARTALDILSTQAWGTAVGLPLGTIILAATRTGDLGTAAAHLRLPVPHAMFESRYGLHYRYARGVYQLARDNAAAAAADFLACGDLMRQWSIDAPGLVPWRTGAAEALLRQGERDQARALLDDQLERLGDDFDSIRGQALRLRANCAPPGQRIALLTDAADIAENGADRFALALVLADLSHASASVGEHRAARLAARRAWHVATSCHAEPLCAALAPKLAGTEDRTDKDAEPALLTRAERRVALLACDGHSNRAIAARLFITESTVEQHLTKVYRKLNVKRRADLLVNLAQM